LAAYSNSNAQVYSDDPPVQADLTLQARSHQRDADGVLTPNEHPKTVDVKTVNISLKLSA